MHFYVVFCVHPRFFHYSFDFFVISLQRIIVEKANLEQNPRKSGSSSCWHDDLQVFLKDNNEKFCSMPIIFCSN